MAAAGALCRGRGRRGRMRGGWLAVPCRKEYYALSGAAAAGHCTAINMSFRSSVSVCSTAMRDMSTAGLGCGSAGAAGRLSLPMNSSCTEQGRRAVGQELERGVAGLAKGRAGAMQGRGSRCTTVGQLAGGGGFGGGYSALTCSSVSSSKTCISASRTPSARREQRET